MDWLKDMFGDKTADKKKPKKKKKPYKQKTGVEAVASERPSYDPLADVKKADIKSMPDNTKNYLSYLDKLQKSEVERDAAIDKAKARRKEDKQMGRNVGYLDKALNALGRLGAAKSGALLSKEDIAGLDMSKYKEDMAERFQDAKDDAHKGHKAKAHQAMLDRVLGDQEHSKKVAEVREANRLEREREQEDKYAARFALADAKRKFDERERELKADQKHAESNINRLTKGFSKVDKSIDKAINDRKNPIEDAEGMVSSIEEGLLDNAGLSGEEKSKLIEEIKDKADTFRNTDSQELEQSKGIVDKFLQRARNRQIEKYGDFLQQRRRAEGAVKDVDYTEDEDSQNFKEGWGDFQKSHSGDKKAELTDESKNVKIRYRLKSGKTGTKVVPRSEVEKHRNNKAIESLEIIEE